MTFQACEHLAGHRNMIISAETEDRAAVAAEMNSVQKSAKSACIWVGESEREVSMLGALFRQILPLTRCHQG